MDYIRVWQNRFILGWRVHNWRQSITENTESLFSICVFSCYESVDKIYTLWVANMFWFCMKKLWERHVIRTVWWTKRRIRIVTIALVVIGFPWQRRWQTNKTGTLTILMVDPSVTSVESKRVGNYCYRSHKAQNNVYIRNETRNGHKTVQ